MRRFTNAALALVASLALAGGAAYANTRPAAASTAKPAMHHLSGRIVSADQSQLVLKETGKNKGREESFALQPDTKVMIKGKAAKATDLKAGESARVSYTASNGTLTATSIKAK